jgi:hypothetical protein
MTTVKVAAPAGLGEKEKAQIEKILGSAGILKDASLEWSAAAHLLDDDPKKPCKDLCTGGEVLAVSQCAGLVLPPLILACVLAAHAAGEYCRQHC